MTADNLKAAFAGESQAHMRYLAFASRAEREGRANVARLFRAISYAEEVHATNHLRELGLIGGTADNLAAAIGGENFEVDEMYPAYIAVAQLQEEKGGQRSMQWAMEAERLHAQFYAAALKAVEAGQDADVAKVTVCPACGYTVLGHAPDKCPVCGAAGKLFRNF
jgi:rubrerythrin